MPNSSSNRERLNKQIGSRINQRRKHIGLEIDELAGLAEINPETLRQIEGGHLAVTAETLFPIAKVLGIPAADLF